MPSLASFQQSIAQLLMRPLVHGEAMDPASTSAADSLVRPNDRLSAFERLQIYNQQYWWRLLGNFAEDFPGLRAVLGVRKFDRLAIAYLQSHGSTSWNLRDLGQHLEAFLTSRPELTEPHSQLALEMTRLEWARIEAFDGESQAPLDPAKLARRNPAVLRLKLQPYITLLELQYPVDELLGRFIQRGNETESASNAVAQGAAHKRVRISARPARNPVFLAIHRVEFSVYYKRLEPEAFRLLTALKSGATLQDACESALGDSTALPEQSAAKIQDWFATWMRLGWFCA